MANATEIKNLIPGKLYVAEFAVIDTKDLERLEFRDQIGRTEKQEMEALLKITLKEKGHVCQFADFKMETIPANGIGHTYDPPMSMTGSLDLGKSTFIPFSFPMKTIRCYFRVQSLTAVIMISVIIAVMTTSFLLVAPQFVSIMEATGDIVKTVKDITLGVIAEPRKLAELGVMAFIPVIALIAAVSFFILKPRGAV